MCDKFELPYLRNVFEEQLSLIAKIKNFSKDEFLLYYDKCKTKAELLEQLGFEKYEGSFRSRHYSFIKNICIQHGLLDLRDLRLSRTRISDEDFSKIVENSVSIAEVIAKSNLVVAGGNYRTTKKRIERLSLDISHFTGQSHQKNIGRTRISTQDYLNNIVPINSNNLKKRLIREKYFEKRCYSCNCETWLDVEIPLELHHIDGNSENNNIENLIVLCPNCHALTDNYRGKNIQKSAITKEILYEKKINHIKNKVEKLCPICAKVFYSFLSDNQIYCSQECSQISQRKTDRPSKEILIDLIKKYSLSKIGEIYNVSDNTIKKWCIAYGFESRDYSPFVNKVNRKDLA